MVILVMGVAGSGKTTVGQLLAGDLGWLFADADDYHSAANKIKMSAGVPLTDEDRQPWIESLHNAILGWIASNENAVLACSALKQEYREKLMVATDVKVVFLRGTFGVIQQRLADRPSHFMNPILLRSQFDTLEEPANAVVVDVAAPPEAIVLRIRKELQI